MNNTIKDIVYNLIKDYNFYNYNNDIKLKDVKIDFDFNNDLVIKLKGTSYIIKIEKKKKEKIKWIYKQKKRKLIE